jgi:hypothetical protein
MRSDNKPELVFDEVPVQKISPEAPPIPATRSVRFVNEGQILTATPATIVSNSDSSEDTEDSSFEPPVPKEPPPRHHEKNPHQFLPPVSPLPKQVLLPHPEKLLNPVAAAKDPKPVNFLTKELKPVVVVPKEDKPVSPVFFEEDKPPSPPRCQCYKTSFFRHRKRCK